MEVLSGIVNFITTYIFNQPFILLSLVAMLGLILQKKPLQDIIVGSLKTGIGYLILSQGTSLLAGIGDAHRNHPQQDIPRGGQHHRHGPGGV